MTTRPEVLEIHPVRLPGTHGERFTLDHPYLEQCWGPVLGPSSVTLLRHCMWHWRDRVPAVVEAAELGAELGLGRGTSSNSPLWHTIDRLVRFRMAGVGASPAELHVYTEVPALDPCRLARLPRWCRDRHEAHLAARLSAMARPAAEAAPPPAARMAAQLRRLTNNPPTPHASLGR